MPKKGKTPDICSFLENYSNVDDCNVKEHTLSKKTKSKPKPKPKGSEDIMDSRLIYGGCYGMGKRR